MPTTPTIAGYPSLCAGATVGQERAGSPDAAGALRWLEADAGDPDTERLTLDLMQAVQRHLTARQRRLEAEAD